MTLFLIRHEPVPVEEIRPNDVLVLPSQRRVTVERVDEYDGVYVVRWWRRAEKGEPGYRSDVMDGRYLGSCVGVSAGFCWNLDRSESDPLPRDGTSRDGSDA